MIWIVLLVAIAALVGYRFLNRVSVDHLPESFVVFALETTGPDPERHEIVEIGAIRVGRDLVVQDSFRSLVSSSAVIPRRVTELTGITQSAIDSEGKPLAEVLTAFTAFAGELPLVAYNADLGMAFLGAAAQRSGVAIGNRITCSKKMASRAWPERKSQGLSELAKVDKAVGAAAHRILDECRKVLSVYVAAASRLGTAD